MQMIFNCNAAIQEASEALGTNWKSAARKLLFSVTDIDSITLKHQDCLRTQIEEFFGLWRARNKGTSSQEMCAKLNKVLQELNVHSGCEREEKTVGACHGQLMHDNRVESDGPMYLSKAQRVSDGVHDVYMCITIKEN